MKCREPAWELSRLPMPKWAGRSPSTRLLLLLEGPSHLPLLSSPWPPSYAPEDPRDLEGALEGRGSAWELSKLRAGQAIALLSSPTLPGESLPPASPDLPSLGHRSCLASTSPPPLVHLCPTGSLWGSSRLLGRQSSPPAAGRHPSCGQMLTPRLPTLPS